MADQNRHSPAHNDRGRADQGLVYVLIFVFLALFVWLQVVDDVYFKYWTFMALLTIVFVGALHATGLIRFRSVALGGSIAVFIALIWYTRDQFKVYEQRTVELSEIRLKFAEERRTSTNRILELTQLNNDLRERVRNTSKELHDHREQDLVIATFDARRLRPVNALRLIYVLRNTDEKEARRNGNLQIIPVSDFRNLMAIFINTDFVNVRPDRPGSTNVGQKTRIDRINLQTMPLQLDLYIALEEI
jgi:hypothetical protein